MTDKPPFDPNAPFSTSAPAGGKPPFDPNAAFSTSAPQQEQPPSSWADTAVEGAKGLYRGLGNFAGDIGEAVMGPFGPGKHAANLMATLRGEKPPTPDPSYGQQIARAIGTESQTPGYAGSIGEFVGNPASYLGPGGPLAKAALAATAGAGSEAGGQLAKGTAYEPAARIAGSLASAPLGGLAAAARNASRVKAPTTAELFDSANQHYSNMKGLGVEIHPSPIAGVATNIRTELLAEGYEDFISPKTFKAIDKLDNAAANKTVTVSQLDNVRKTLGKAAGDPAERDAARRAIGHIDDYLANLDPADVAVNPHFAGRVGEEARLARGDYAAAKHAESVEAATNKAELQAASTGSGANIDNATRQKFRAILNSPKQRRGFSLDELNAMEQLVRGTSAGNTARLIGKLAPTGVVSGALSGMIGEAAGHAIGVPVLGLAAKAAGDLATRRNASRISEQVRLRSPEARRIGAEPKPRLQPIVRPLTGLSRRLHLIEPRKEP